MCKAIGVLVCLAVAAWGSVFHKFEIWGGMSGDQKMALYIGWTNGYFHDLTSLTPTATCLESISPTQATAIIDKRYINHPETWAKSIGDQIYAAMTGADGPCQVKVKTSN